MMERSKDRPAYCTIVKLITTHEIGLIGTALHVYEMPLLNLSLGIDLYVFLVQDISQPSSCTQNCRLNVCRYISWVQGGITCGAIDEPWKSSKAIDKRVITNFRDKNVAIARFRDKNEVFV